MITVYIDNTDTNDIFVAITDSNLNPPAVVYTNTRINNGQSFPASVQEDGNGKCLLQILAVNANDASKTKAFPDQSCSNGQHIQVDVFGV